MTVYREKMYDRYASIFQSGLTPVDAKEVASWGLAYDHYLRQWLPARKDAAILDMGCGAGILLRYLKRKGFVNLQGVDVSPEQVRLARQEIPGVHQDDVIGFLESHPESFDLLVGIDIVEHFEKEEILRFLDGSMKALKPGGRIVLQTLNAESPFGMGHRYGDFTHEVAFAPRCLERILRLAGFGQIKFREAGPVFHGVLSLIRCLLWKALWLLVLFWNLVETGDKNDGVYTRIFLISGIKMSR